MKKNKLFIRHSNNSLQVSWQYRQIAAQVAPSVPFDYPFEPETLEKLRWYLEDYLRYPYGIYPEEAVNIEQQFQVWGEKLFELTFCSCNEAWELFQNAVSQGLEQCQIVIVSDNPTFLNLPWELLYSPEHQFLVPCLAGIYRQVKSAQTITANPVQQSQKQLNILLVIARPCKEDVGFRTVARPILEALKPIGNSVNLKVLRPPTFKQLESELNANIGFYHIVHFDGHGTINDKGQGELIFENDFGTRQNISAHPIAQKLANCGVPLFVLNACKSAQEKEETFSSVATQLILSGAKGVVAMAYTVYAEAVKYFMGELYRQLATGVSLSSAVTSARNVLINKPLRPSPKGNKPLKDWLVPVLYQQEDYTLFTPQVRGESSKPQAETINVPEEGTYGFVGRDFDLLRLERAFRKNNVCLLKGLGGIGKTELAIGFAQWLSETQERAGGIFFTSFEYGSGLSSVVNQIGRILWGSQFSQLLIEEQQTKVLEYLRTHPCLLIWDNFELVAGFPKGNEPILTSDERENLKQFIQDLQGGMSWILITSRHEESWLDYKYQSLVLSELSQRDTEELAEKIVQRVEVDLENLPQEYSELLQLLGGHPFSLRVVLPHLKTQHPMQIIEALRLGLDLFEGTEEEGRDKSITVALDYAFSRLSDRTRQHLPFLAFFSKRVDINSLHGFSSYAPTYNAIFGEILGEDERINVLQEAVNVGILEKFNREVIQVAPSLYITLEYKDESIFKYIFKISPTLPWYLRRRLLKISSLEKVNELEKNLIKFYAYFANYLLIEELDSSYQSALSNVLIQEPNLLKALQILIHEQNWEFVQQIAQILITVYGRSGRLAESKSLKYKIMNTIGREFSEVKLHGEDAVDLWIYILLEDAEDIGRTSETIELVEKLHNIKNILLCETLDSSKYQTDQIIAEINERLGCYEQRIRNFDKANRSYYQALYIYLSNHNFDKVSSMYHQIGNIAFLKGEYKKAERYYYRACHLKESNGNFYRSAIDYYQLALLAEQQGDIDKALKNLEKASRIYSDFGDFQKIAEVLLTKARLLEKLKNWSQTQKLYEQALQIFEDLPGNDYSIAATLYELGRLAFEQKKYKEAESYSRKAFEIATNIHNWQLTRYSLKDWGRAVEYQNNLIEALKLYIRALVINIGASENEFESCQDNIARVSVKLGSDNFESTLMTLINSQEYQGEALMMLRLTLPNSNRTPVNQAKKIKPDYMIPILCHNIIELIGKRNPERLDIIFDTFSQAEEFHKHIIKTVCISLGDDYDSLAWFCSYMSSEINTTADNK
ncbi:tetratricopeptide repeat protein [Limnoraphis robusta]|uniref:tetratricopeptide repeat protein n=1 Tax=Limnoraphis robusta TaxID=1118279 RepID=UPI00066EBFB3|nr:tetratricopeptide repeat protein [Limnoraphis robusta]